MSEETTLLQGIESELDSILGKFRKQINTAINKDARDKTNPQRSGYEQSPRGGWDNDAIIHRLHPVTGQPIQQQQTPQQTGQPYIPKWRGLRGLGRWLWKGYAPDNPDFSHLYKKEHRLTLDEYNAQTEYFRQFADEIIEEAWGNLRGQPAVDAVLTQLAAAIITWIRTSKTVKQYAQVAKPKGASSPFSPSVTPSPETKKAEKLEDELNSWISPLGYVNRGDIKSMLKHLTAQGIDILNPHEVKDYLTHNSRYQGNGDLALTYIKNHNSTVPYPERNSVNINDPMAIKKFLSNVGYEGNGVIPNNMMVNVKAGVMKQPDAEEEPAPEERPTWGVDSSDEPAPFTPPDEEPGTNWDKVAAKAEKPKRKRTPKVAPMEPKGEPEAAPIPAAKEPEPEPVAAKEPEITKEPEPEKSAEIPTAVKEPETPVASLEPEPKKTNWDKVAAKVDKPKEKEPESKPVTAKEPEIVKEPEKSEDKPAESRPFDAVAHMALSPKERAKVWDNLSSEERAAVYKILANERKKDKKKKPKNEGLFRKYAALIPN